MERIIGIDQNLLNFSKRPGHLHHVGIRRRLLRRLDILFVVSQRNGTGVKTIKNVAQIRAGKRLLYRSVKICLTDFTDIFFGSFRIDLPTVLRNYPFTGRGASTIGIMCTRKKHHITSKNVRSS